MTARPGGACGPVAWRQAHSPSSQSTPGAILGESLVAGGFGGALQCIQRVAAHELVEELGEGGRGIEARGEQAALVAGHEVSGARRLGGGEKKIVIRVRRRSDLRQRAAHERERADVVDHPSHHGLCEPAPEVRTPGYAVDLLELPLAGAQHELFSVPGGVKLRGRRAVRQQRGEEDIRVEYDAHISAYFLRRRASLRTPRTAWSMVAWSSAAGTSRTLFLTV